MTINIKLLAKNEGNMAGFPGPRWINPHFILSTKVSDAQYSIWFQTQLSQQLFKYMLRATE